ncbi:hypothetical protein MNBD_ALPHA12-1701 [hydrothermal vent metagenome]|uniref:SH3b domain-containing protein n=1 Tax=hydrothermal vent metagenome TaxID=652676 RepID=A0A3B0UM55_9ZZZZ
MNRAQKNLMIAMAAGLIILSAAALAIGPAKAAGFTPQGYNVAAKGKIVGVKWWDQLNVRMWPASYSRPVGTLAPATIVWVERCITVENSSDWCKVGRDRTYGWVNSRYLVRVN